ncbi:hypothetical protein HCR18_03990 [Wolbachia pipientis]|nr:hypothetical protein [Wolbachia pipientis]MBA8758210.1 hypothetical protein [Wolbachia pipientis]MBA8770515.1 hypothetical protein [Wolbachia pipientis]
MSFQNSSLVIPVSATHLYEHCSLRAIPTGKVSFQCLALESSKFISYI